MDFTATAISLQQRLADHLVNAHFSLDLLPHFPGISGQPCIGCCTCNLASDKQKKIDGWKGKHFSLTSGRSPGGHWLVSRPVWLSWIELVVCFCFFVYFLIYFFNWNKWFHISYILKCLFNKIYKIYIICYQCSLFPVLNKLKVLLLLFKPLLWLGPKLRSC